MRPYMIAFILSFVSIWANGAQTDASQWLRPLLNAQAREAAACSEPIRELMPLEARVIQGPNPAHTYYQNKASALEALNKLAKYPGRSGSATAILEHVLNDTSVIPAARVSALLRAKPCNEVSYFKAFRHLISSARHWEFNPGEVESLKKVVMKFVIDDLEHPMTRISLGVRLSLVRQMLDWHLLNLTITQLAEFDRLEKEAHQNMQVLAQKSKQWPSGMNADNTSQFPAPVVQDFLNDMLSEITAVKKMEKQLNDLLQS